jgi:predicted Fe-Mo cluster-binding NifX family protein
MLIAVTSQNFRTITQHAGKSRRFLIFAQDANGQAVEVERLDLPLEMSMHEFKGEDHPIFKVDLLVTGSSGQGFIKRLAQHGVRVIATQETDPLKAVETLFAGKTLAPAEPHIHEHHPTPVMPRQ